MQQRISGCRIPSAPGDGERGPGLPVLSTGSGSAAVGAAEPDPGHRGGRRGGGDGAAAPGGSSPGGTASASTYRYWSPACSNGRRRRLVSGHGVQWPYPALPATRDTRLRPDRVLAGAVADGQGPLRRKDFHTAAVSVRAWLRGTGRLERAHELVGLGRLSATHPACACRAAIMVAVTAKHAVKTVAALGPAQLRTSDSPFVRPGHHSGGLVRKDSTRPPRPALHPEPSGPPAGFIRVSGTARQLLNCVSARADRWDEADPCTTTAGHVVLVSPCDRTATGQPADLVVDRGLDVAESFLGVFRLPRGRWNLLRAATTAPRAGHRGGPRAMRTSHWRGVARSARRALTESPQTFVI
ncbi:hypothetical protein QFZ24_000669 [Streptomyces phaeochromogenes]|nr:hypothetical protein [Streptomyces phaeochromogenes]